MGTCSFRDMEEACKRLGLVRHKTKNGEIWMGADMNGAALATVIHMHAGGRDIPSGTFHQMIRDLGFKDEMDFKDFIGNKRRVR